MIPQKWHTVKHQDSISEQRTTVSHPVFPLWQLFPVSSYILHDLFLFTDIKLQTFQK